MTLALEALGSCNRVVGDEISDSEICRTLGLDLDCFRGFLLF